MHRLGSSSVAAHAAPELIRATPDSLCRRHVEPRKIRVVVAKPGLDGHDRGAKIIARALRDAGMEVIYTGLHQTPEQIVETVLQEDADAVGLSILSGAHMTLVPRIAALLKDEGAEDVVLVVGGTIPSEDIPELKELGVAEVFTPGAPGSGDHRLHPPGGTGLGGARRGRRGAPREPVELHERLPEARRSARRRPRPAYSGLDLGEDLGSAAAMRRRAPRARELDDLGAAVRRGRARARRSRAARGPPPPRPPTAWSGPSAPPAR